MTSHSHSDGRAAQCERPWIIEVILIYIAVHAAEKNLHRTALKEIIYHITLNHSVLIFNYTEKLHTALPEYSYHKSCLFKSIYGDV